METPTGTSNATDRWRATLKRHHITYDETVHGRESSTLPARVEAVRSQLVNLNYIVPHYWEETYYEGPKLHELWVEEFRNDLQKPEHAQVCWQNEEHVNKRNLPDDRLPQEIHWENFKEGIQLRKDAKDRSEIPGGSESPYNSFLTRTLLKKWVDLASKKADARDPVGGIAYFERDILFHKRLVRGRDRASVDTDGTFKSPKPDVTFAFPIYVNQCDKLNIHAEDEIFSSKNLAKLETLGIWPSPRFELGAETNKGKFIKVETGIQNSENANFGTNGLLQCYPWAIVEVKMPNTTEEQIKECYCQALNGCSAALEMLERLYSPDPTILLPPIVALTFIGPETKAWLAYSEPIKSSSGARKTRRRMVCIWEGSLTSPVDAVKMIRLRENILKWVKADFKEKIRLQLQTQYRRLVEGNDNEPEAHSDGEVPSMMHSITTTPKTRPTKNLVEQREIYSDRKAPEPGRSKKTLKSGVMGEVHSPGSMQNLSLEKKVPTIEIVDGSTPTKTGRWQKPVISEEDDREESISKRQKIPTNSTAPADSMAEGRSQQQKPINPYSSSRVSVLDTVPNASPVFSYPEMQSSTSARGFAEAEAELAAMGTAYKDLGIPQTDTTGVIASPWRSLEKPEAVFKIKRNARANDHSTEPKSARGTRTIKESGQNLRLCSAFEEPTSFNSTTSGIHDTVPKNRAASEPVSTLPSSQTLDLERRIREISLLIPGAYPTDDEDTDNDGERRGSKQSVPITSTINGRPTFVLGGEFSFRVPRASRSVTPTPQLPASFLAAPVSISKARSSSESRATEVKSTDPSPFRAAIHGDDWQDAFAFRPTADSRLKVDTNPLSRAHRRSKSRDA